MASSTSHRTCLLHLPSSTPHVPFPTPPFPSTFSLYSLRSPKTGSLCFGVSRWDFRIRASSDRVSSDGSRGLDWIGRGRAVVDTAVDRLHRAVGDVPPLRFAIKKNMGFNLAVSLSIVFALLLVTLRKLHSGMQKHGQRGTVADLVRRGQLRSDRRGISKPLKYDDPFTNPLVKVHKSNSMVEICGKVYRMAPVTLTEEEQSSHKMRRSRAYNWKRPTVFLKEGDEIPPDVDPDTIRWIPANHPFATTVSDIDENMAQKNVFQTDGVPFRIRAEHEALQKKLEALQADQKLDKISITPNSFRGIERQSNSSPTKDNKLDSNPFIEQNLGQSDKKSHFEGFSDERPLPEDFKMP